MIIKTTGTALVAMLAATGALAQDAGLYPDPGSPDASFVRIIAPGLDEATIDGEPVEFETSGVTSYVEAEPGELSITVGETSETFEIGANTHYSFVPDAGEDALIEDAVKDSPTQADLLLYNLSELQDFDLYAVEAETAALSDIAPGSHEGVGLKAPLTLTFEIRQDGETLAALDPVDLRRGVATTIVLTGDADAASASVTTSTYTQ